MFQLNNVKSKVITVEAIIASGSLLFHNWQDPHYNIKPKRFTRGFYAELKESWFENFDLNKNNLQGSINISNPDIKLLMYQIFKESKLNDDTTSLSIQSFAFNNCICSQSIQQTLLHSQVDKMMEKYILPAFIKD